jgi:hypothetical protein
MLVVKSDPVGPTRTAMQARRSNPAAFHGQQPTCFSNAGFIRNSARAIGRAKLGHEDHGGNERRRTDGYGDDKLGGGNSNDILAGGQGNSKE